MANTPELMATLKTTLSQLSLGLLWLNYERCTEDLERAMGRLRDDPLYPLTPAEKVDAAAEVERHRQYLQTYREVLTEKGWDGMNPPAEKDLLHCGECGRPLCHWDRDDEVCDTCIEDDWQEKRRRYNEDRWEWH
jgi:hypothetical protein